MYFTKYTSEKYLPPIIGKIRDKATTLMFYTLSNSVAIMEQVAMQVVTWIIFGGTTPYEHVGVFLP